MLRLTTVSVNDVRIVHADLQNLLICTRYTIHFVLCSNNKHNTVQYLKYKMYNIMNFFFSVKSTTLREPLSHYFRGVAENIMY